MMHPAVRGFLILGLALLAPMSGAVERTATAQENTTITMWFDTVGGVETPECVVAQSVDTFNALDNGVTVEATLQANGWDATRTALAGGAGPDIVTTPGPSFVMPLALAGQLAPLTDYAEQFGPWALAGLIVLLTEILAGSTVFRKVP